jgi:hypothetical protein
MTIEVLETPELAPEPPPHRARVWLRENLFSSPASSVMSVLAILLVLFAYRGFLSFVTGEDRRWDAVTYNMRLLMVQAYPQEQSARLWISVGIVAVMLAVTFAFYRIGGKTSPRKLGTVFVGIGSAAVVGAFVGPWGLALSPFGIKSARGFVWWLLIGLVVGIGGYLLRKLPGDAAKNQVIPILGVVLVGIVGVLVFMWTVSLPQPARVDGEQTIIYEKVASTTTIPWTVIAIITVVAFWLMWLVRDRLPEGGTRAAIIGLWVASFPAIYIVILRDPDVDYGRAFTWYLPLALGFIVLGGLLLNFMAGAKGEAGRALGAVLLVVAIASYLIPMEYVVRFLLLLLAVFALLAPTFGGKGASRWRFLGLWAGLVAVIVYILMVLTAPSTVEVPGKFYLGGRSSSRSRRSCCPSPSASCSPSRERPRCRSSASWQRCTSSSCAGCRSSRGSSWRSSCSRWRCHPGSRSAGLPVRSAP